MAMRWGPGPVFAYEWLMLARRWQLYAGRGLFILMLFAGLSIVWQTEVAHNPTPSIRQQALVGEKFFYALIGIQLTLVMLAAPAATAGAICQDKTRGTLAHLLVTDLSNWEIILGKLAVRLGPVLGLIGCSIPILFMGSLFGGIDLEALIFAYLITIAVGILGCALALFLSVWAAKTHEVLVVVYLTWCLLLLAGPIWHVAGWYFSIGTPPSWFDDRNAFWLAFAPYSDPKATDWRDDLGFVGVSLALSALLVLLAVLRVRAVAVRQMSRSEQKRGSRPFRSFSDFWWRWLPGPSLDGNPVLWREWYRKRSSRWIRVVWTLYAVLAVTFTILVLSQISSQTRTFGAFATIVSALQVAIGLLLVSVAAVTTLADERSRNNMEVLLTTPLSSRSILWAKWLGAYRGVPLLAILPAAISFTLAWNWQDVSSRPSLPKQLVYDEHPWLNAMLIVAMILVPGAAIVSLGVALATWIPKLGRAVTWSVSAYVLLNIGWLIAVETMYAGSPSPMSDYLALASPWFAAASLTEALSILRAWPAGDSHLLWGAGWTVLFAFSAILLFLVTLLTFDRCLGRMSHQPRRKQSFSRPDTSAEPLLTSK